MRNNINYQEVVCDQCGKVIKNSHEVRIGQSVNDLAGWLHLSRTPTLSIEYMVTFDFCSIKCLRDFLWEDEVTSEVKKKGNGRA